MEIQIVYKTDSHHSYASRDIIGIATSPASAIFICLAKAKKEGEKIGQEQIWNLNNLKQTQGYSGEGEFQFEEGETNKLF